MVKNKLISEEDLKARFGKTYAWGDPELFWESCNVPCGPEGSVQYEIKKTKRGNEICWGIVYLWGDLRDYDDAQEIYEWIKRACRGLMIRSCCVKIDIEMGKSYIIYDKEINGEVEIIMSELFENRIFEVGNAQKEND